MFAKLLCEYYYIFKMILNFKNGFEINKMKFGYTSQGLYRLPQMMGKRFYPLKKIPIIYYGKGKKFGGYRCNRKTVSFLQIKSLIKKNKPFKIEVIK